MQHLLQVIHIILLVLGGYAIYTMGRNHKG